MINKNESFNRRKFVKTAAALSAGVTGFTLFPGQSFAMPDGRSNIIGPKEGYSPQVGTLVSMMDWMRSVILSPVQGLTVEQLDYVHDDHANSIGSMLLHLAATERYYQLHTFNGMKWGSWDDSIKKQWDLPMQLGAEARARIKGNSLDFYLDTLAGVRANTHKELKNRDDKWLMSVDEKWPWGPTNNYCKWFHVVEHESNHNGQIKFIKSRLPGMKGGGD
ncbi:MAG TPA: DUF664 domain-containing protein [Chitinophagaceae bacterium]|nr:DUF664 domain-containing protein [Chitinophagaceae bacterium]